MAVKQTSQFALSAVQAEAVAASGKVVFLTGPGGGKSLVVGERAARLIETGAARPEEVLILAPARRAVSALSDYLQRRLPGFPAPAITTFHGLALIILRAHYRRLGYSQFPEVLDTMRHFAVLRRLLADEDPSDWSRYGPFLGSRTMLNLAHDWVVSLAENGWDEADLPHLAALGVDEWRALAAFYKRYRQRQREAQRLDFAELLAGVAGLLASDTAVRETYRHLYRHILVDEFEEANYVQARILSHLVGETTDLLVAGDPAQAINAYRNGSASYLQACPEWFGARVLVDRQNHRSLIRLSSVVAAARPGMAFFEPNKATPIVTVGVTSPCPVGHSRLEQGDLGPLDRVSLHLATTENSAIPSTTVAEEASRSSRHEGYALLRTFTYPSDEARWVGVAISSLIRAGVPSDEIAILFRSTAAPLAKMIVRELARRSVSHHLRATRGAFEEPLVRAMPALLRWLGGVDEDGEAFTRLLRSPLAGLPAFGFRELKRALAAADKKVGHLTLEDVNQLSLPEPVRQALQDFLSRLEDLRGKIHWSVPNLLWEVWRLLPAFRKDASAGAKGSAAFGVFLAEVSELQEQHPALTLTELASLVDEGHFDHLPSPSSLADGVTVTTVHQAKGQEWDVVFLPGLVEGRFPIQPPSPDSPSPALVWETMGRLGLPPNQAWAGETGDWQRLSSILHAEEEARVFYVAVSRARRGLYLSYSCRSTDGQATETPSGLLDRLAGHPYLEVVSGEEVARLPSDIGDAVAHYRRLLASPAPLLQAQALYALAWIRRERPEAVQPEYWWENVKETEGAPPPFPDGKLYLSASRLSRYRDCPLSYQFSVHWLLGEPEGTALAKGNVLHQVLERYHGTDAFRPRTRETLETLLESCFVEKDFRYRPIARQAKKDLQRMLDAYFARYGLAGAAIAVERSFRFAFDGHTISGRIDRIDRLPSGGLEFFDYKSGSPMSAADAEEDLQLALYDLACQEDPSLRTLGQPEKVTYLYPKAIGPRADGKRSYAPTAESRQRLRLRIRAYAGAISAERFPPPRAIAGAFPQLDGAELDLVLGKKRNDPCRFCDFQWICPEMESGGPE